MEGVAPRLGCLKIVVATHRPRALHLVQNEKSLRGFVTRGQRGHIADSNDAKVNTNTNVILIDSIKCLVSNIRRCERILNDGLLVTLASLHANTSSSSMLKRSHSIEFDPDQMKSVSGSESSRIIPVTPPSSSSPSSLANSKDENNEEDSESPQISKKPCNSTPEESEGSPESGKRSDPYRRYAQTSDNGHVTQSRSIFSHRDSFVYGNPKEDIRRLDKQAGGEATSGEPCSAAIFEAPTSSNVLDLSCKTIKGDVEKTDAEESTYRKYHRTGHFGGESTAPRSIVEIKLVNQGNPKKPSLPEQLEIAKIQQQQRRSMQQQQKFLQQMRKSFDSKSSNRHDSSQTVQKGTKHLANSATNHENNELDNHQRGKDEYYPRYTGVPFPHLTYPYFDPNHPKELPDNHPILPLLDPVYFSALYNAHGFLPPSSPSIAAAFIGTLQDALPKLPIMLPSTSSTTSPLLTPQKTNENPN